MMSAPEFAFAVVIAWRNEPAPVSFVLLTEIVPAVAGEVEITMTLRARSAGKERLFPVRV